MPAPPRVRPAPRLRAIAFGERGVLVRVEGAPRDVGRAAAAIRDADPSLDVGAGSHGVLVVAPAPLDPLRRAELQTTIATALAASRARPETASRRHVVEVVYDGPDLDAVADAAGMARDDVVRAHVEREVEVEVLGFLPGFAYMAEIDPRLRQPRRAQPRTRVPAGSVAIAGRFTGIYPTASPGGWNLLGTAVGLTPFDPAREPPALFAPGDVVRFVATDHDRATRPTDDTPGPVEGPASARAVRLTRVAALATVQDAGRAQWLGRGVPASGAVDPVALAAANLAVGNDPGAAALEIAGGGCRLEIRGDVLASIDGEPGVLPRDGGSLDVQPSTRLCRYVALRGGLVVPEVLGSRSTAVAASLGGHAGRPLRAGDVIAVGDDPGTRVPQRALLPIPSSPTPLVLRVDLLPASGPLDAASIEALLAGDFTVSRHLDRTGVRLDGPAVPRAPEADARPEPVLPGAVQIPGDGRPIVLGPDAAVTGGYPVIGIVRKTSLWSLYRLRPGAPVRFARA